MYAERAITPPFQEITRRGKICPFSSFPLFASDFFLFLHSPLVRLSFHFRLLPLLRTFFCLCRAASMEGRDVSYHHYKSRDFEFGQLLLTLRKRTSLTQEEVALQMDVTTKALRNWEGGSNYPSDVNLQKLITLYLGQHAFAPGYERDEAHALWEQLHESTHRRISSFDEQWFATVLTQWQAKRTSPEPHPQGSQPPAQPGSLEQQPAVPLASREAAQLGR